MEKKNKIFGISFDSEVINICDEFDEIYFESDNAFFVSKETFHHEEEGFQFDYRYAIEADECGSDIYYSLMLVPCANSLTKEKLKSVAQCSGLEPDEVTIYDICIYGCNVTLGSMSVKEDETNKKYLDLIASVYKVIDSMRGFYLDKYVNRIGNTGWDLLDDFVNGNDFIKKALG